MDRPQDVDHTSDGKILVLESSGQIKMFTKDSLAYYKRKLPALCMLCELYLFLGDRFTCAHIGKRKCKLRSYNTKDKL